MSCCLEQRTVDLVVWAIFTTAAHRALGNVSCETVTLLSPLVSFELCSNIAIHTFPLEQVSYDAILHTLRFDNMKAKLSIFLDFLPSR